MLPLNKNSWDDLEDELKFIEQEIKTEQELEMVEFLDYADYSGYDF